MFENTVKPNTKKHMTKTERGELTQTGGRLEIKAKHTT